MWSTRVCVHFLASIHTWLCRGVRSGLNDHVTDSFWLVQLTHNVLYHPYQYEWAAGLPSATTDISMLPLEPLPFLHF